MKRILYIFAMTMLSLSAIAQARFPKPDFESGYQYPEQSQYVVPVETIWLAADIFILVLLMSVVAWAVIRKGVRWPVIAVSMVSVIYFGFFRHGCVCSIGAIQNVSLGLVEPSFVVPLAVILFFILPIIFALLFGRVFCAGVCPFGALQELVNIKNYRLSRAVTTTLGLIPWIYLTLAVLFAITRSGFIICRFDPFIGIFRLGGDMGLIIFGVVLLLISIFIGRPFCRFICPYGAILGLISRFSIWGVKITKKECINCDLCHDGCPVDAIEPPYQNRVKESRTRGLKRIVNYMVILPLLMLLGALSMRAMSGELSRANKIVALNDMVLINEQQPADVQSMELEAFYGQGGSVEMLAAAAQSIVAEFKLYSTFAGAFLGLVVGLTLIGLSLKRSRTSYAIDPSGCVSCGRCLGYCPQNKGDI